MNDTHPHSGVKVMIWFLIFSILYLELAILVASPLQPEIKEPIITLIISVKRTLPNFLHILFAMGVIGAGAALVTRKLWVGPH